MSENGFNAITKNNEIPENMLFKITGKSLKKLQANFDKINRAKSDKMKYGAERTAVRYQNIEEVSYHHMSKKSGCAEVNFYDFAEILECLEITGKAVTKYENYKKELIKKSNDHREWLKNN